MTSRRLFFLFALIFSGFAGANEAHRLIMDEEAIGQPRDFSLKNIFHQEDKLENFGRQILSTIQFESKDEFKYFLKKSTSEKIYNAYFKDGDLFVTLLYKMMKSDQALPSLLTIITQKTKILAFVAFLFITALVSRYLSELARMYPLFQRRRLMLMSCSFFSISFLRIAAFVAIFSAHLAPSWQIYASTLAEFPGEYSLLLKAQSVIILTFSSIF